MSVQKFSYKGKKIKIDQEGESAQVKIEDRDFHFHLHPGALPLWTCDEAYSMSPDLKALTKHLVDYWYIVNDPKADQYQGHQSKPEAKKKKSGKKA
jgi:hypothetical protein